MIRFMLLSAPRSGSTWASNWLTTERTLCLHDPILQHAPQDMDAIQCDRTLGLACTGLPLLTDFVNAHSARKVIVHRARAEVDASLVEIGLTALTHRWDRALEQLDGRHVDWKELFDPRHAAPIYEFLTGLPFDAPRHAQLVQMQIEPAFNRLQLAPGRAAGFRRAVMDQLNVRAA